MYGNPIFILDPLRTGITIEIIRVGGVPVLRRIVAVSTGNQYAPPE
jgi:hypothetical protein